MKNKKTFVVHYCKNPKCNNAWIDIDLTNAKTRPPRWKYCEDCCKKYGYINPATPPKRKNAEDRIKRIASYQFSTQKKSSKTSEKTDIYIKETKNKND